MMLTKVMDAVFRYGSLTQTPFARLRLFAAYIVGLDGGEFTRRGAPHPLLLQTLIIPLFICVFQTSVFAASPEPPHEGKAAETGIISGTLLKDGRSPLPGETVVLEIFRDSELLLAIPKKAGAKGDYEFKNIFQSPEFSYSISSEYEGKTYRTEGLSLKKGEKQRTLNLTVGAGGKISPPLPLPVRGEEETTGAVHKHEDPNLRQYKLLAILLSVGAIGYAIYRRKK